MIGLSDLKSALGNYGGHTTVNLLSDIRKHINWFVGAPDNVSGIEIEDKEYPLVVGNDGCWWYITDDGCKVKATDAQGEFVGKVINANEKFLKEFGGCYDTGNGDVQIEGWVSLNDLHEIRRGELYVVLSTDPAYTEGTKLVSFKDEVIPAGWKEIACRFPDMTKRVLREFDACYSLPGNSTSGEPTHEIQIKGYEVLDYNLSYKPLGKDDQYLSHTAYWVANQIGTPYQVGDKIDEIPDNWIPQVCRFPDLTQRHVETTEQCYRTENNLLVRIRGQERWNNWDWTRVLSYIIIYSDDPAYPVDTHITTVPAGWINIKCYDADDTLRHQMSFTKCVKINGKRIKLETFRIINNEFNIDKTLYIVKQSDDIANYPVNKEFFELPIGYADVDCDMPDLEDRDPIRVHECYATKFNEDGSVSGKIEIVGWETVDAFGDIESNNYTVINSTDITYPVNHVFTDPVPTSFRKIDCDFPDSEARDTELIKENCYQTPNGVIQVTGTMTYEQKTGSSIATLWAVSLQVIRSTDPNYSTGQMLDITTFDQSWIKITCMFPDMTERHIEHTIRCYSTPGGSVKIVNYVIYNNTLTPELSRIIVINTTDNSFPMDTHIDVIPDDWDLQVCDFPDMEERHLSEDVQCYEFPAATDNSYGKYKVSLKTFEIFDNVLQQTVRKYIVVDATGKSPAPYTTIGEVIANVPNNAVRVVCDMADAKDRYVSTQTYCYKNQAKATRIKVQAVLIYRLENRQLGYPLNSSDNIKMIPENITGTIVWSDDPAIGADQMNQPVFSGTKVAFDGGDKWVLDVPDGYARANCDMPNLEQRYLDVVPQGTFQIPNSGVRVKISKRNIVDHEFEIETTIFTIDESSEPISNPVGTILQAIPADWVKVQNTIPDYTTVHSEVRSVCIKDAQGKLARLSKITHVENNDGNPLEVYYFVEQSEIAALAIGSRLDALTGYTEVVCSMPDLEQRYLDVIPQGTFQIPDTGVRVKVSKRDIVDHEFGIETTIFTIDESSEPISNPVGTILQAIPADWVKVQNIIPDYTTVHSEVRSVCIKDAEGKLARLSKITHAENNDGNPLEVYYFVEQSDIAALVIGSRLDALTGYTEVVCSMPDMEQRYLDVEPQGTFRIPDTGVRVKVSKRNIVDHEFGIETTIFTIDESSDPTQNSVGSIMQTIPANWVKIQDTIPDYSTVHSETRTVCVKDANGKRASLTKITHVENNDGTPLATYYFVEQSEIAALVVGERVNSLTGYIEVVCDLPNLDERHLDVVSQGTYKVGITNTKVTVTKRHIIDHEFGSDKIIYTVDNSTDLVNYPIGKVLDSIPADWVQVHDDILDMTGSHSMLIKGCYANAAGTEKIYIEGIILMDMYLTELRRKMNVMQSTSATHAVGSVLTSIPAGWNEVQCNCNCQA